jgi:NAD(P)-dependent dehydrogenase (short-subunit alcohol dehydrogenase family)
MKSKFDLAGQVVTITGAAGDIGRAAALAVAGCGAAVVLGDVDDGRLRETAELVVAAGGKAAMMHVDVREPADAASFAKLAVERFGRLDGALCVAGVIGRETILTSTLENWKAVNDINLTGTFLCVQAAAREMIACGHGGSIVVYSSGIVQHSPPRGVEYSSGKLGMLALMRSSAGELGPHGIRVNAIAPGVIQTQMSRPESWPRIAEQAVLKRVGVPDDLTGPACFLLSEDAGYITGLTMYVNGGLFMT